MVDKKVNLLVGDVFIVVPEEYIREKKTFEASFEYVKEVVKAHTSKDALSDDVEKQLINVLTSLGLKPKNNK